MWLEGFKPPAGIRVEQTGYVEHARAVEEMCSATALLLYVPQLEPRAIREAVRIPRFGPTVAALAHPDNLASRLVREWDAGVVADPHDGTEIEQAILALWRRWEDDGLSDQSEVRRRTLERYSRRANAERLAEVLDEAARRP